MTSGLWFTADSKSAASLSPSHFIYSRGWLGSPKEEIFNVMIIEQNVYTELNTKANLSLYLFWVWRGGWSDAFFCTSFITIIAKFSSRLGLNFPQKDLLGFSRLHLFPLSVWRIAIAPRRFIMWACRLLNSSYRKDQVKFECLLFGVPKVQVTFGVLEVWNRLCNVLCGRLSTLFRHFAEGVGICWAVRPWVRATEKNCQADSKVLVSVRFARTLSRLSSLSKLKLLIRLWLLRCRGVWENIFISSSDHWLYTSRVQQVN